MGNRSQEAPPQQGRGPWEPQGVGIQGQGQGQETLPNPTPAAGATTSALAAPQNPTPAAEATTSALAAMGGTSAGGPADRHQGGGRPGGERAPGADIQWGRAEPKSGNRQLADRNATSKPHKQQHKPGERGACRCLTPGCGTRPVANDMANAPAQPAAQVQPLADLPVQSTKKVPLAEQAAEKVLQPLAELPAQAAVFQPLAALLPAQAAAELVQPGPGVALA